MDGPTARDTDWRCLTERGPRGRRTNPRVTDPGMLSQRKPATGTMRAHTEGETETETETTTGREQRPRENPGETDAEPETR